MVRTSAERINTGRLVKMGVVGILVTLLALASGVPTRAQEAPRDQATIVLDRMLTYLRVHPRIRGRFEHLYLDRARDVELRATGRFAVELPRIGITFDGESAQRVAIDETAARVLVPREGEPPLLLAFRLDTTPLPSLLSVLAGTTPIEDAYAARRVPAEGGDVIELRPTDATSQVDRVWLELDGSGQIGRVMIVDWRGATHRVVLTETTYPARVPASALAPAFPADAILVEP